MSQKTESRRTTLPVDHLLLDEENPRLASLASDDETQTDLIRLLWEEEAVEEVALSIAENGYFEHEPLLVIPHEKKKDRYVVVEGNRRLAAVLLLRSKELRGKLKVTELPEISAPKRTALDAMPVVVFEGREPVWAYLGFRHIHGTREWDSFSKAQYVANVHERFGIPLAEIARRIGDKNSTVERFYRGYAVLMQAEKAGVFAREDRAKNKFYFSHLYTATDQVGYQRHLGIDPSKGAGPNPVPRSKHKELGELLTWIYGKKSEGKEPIVRTQNPHLNQLRDVLEKPAALAVLRAGRSLESAHEVSVGDIRRFEEAVAAAKSELQQAKATVTTGYSGATDLMDEMDAIMKLATSIVSEMRLIQKGPRKG